MSRSKINNQSIISKSKEIWGEDTYDYSKLNYVYAREHLIFICNKHKEEFLQKVHNHYRYQGCPSCIKENKVLVSKSKSLPIEDFLRKAKEIHGDKYDYSKVQYTNWLSHITIICPKHGEFQQQRNSHLAGNGCKICSERSLTRKGGISKLDYKDMVSFYLYKFTDETDSFLKVGVTTMNPISKRFNKKGFYHYSKEELFVKDLTLEQAIILETSILNHFKDYRYYLKSSNTFKGYTEILNLDCQELIFDFIKQYLGSLSKADA